MIYLKGSKQKRQNKNSKLEINICFVYHLPPDFKSKSIQNGWFQYDAESRIKTQPPCIVWHFTNQSSVAGWNWLLLLMAEIPNNHLGCILMGYTTNLNWLAGQPDFWTINRISMASFFMRKTSTWSTHINSLPHHPLNTLGWPGGPGRAHVTLSNSQMSFLSSSADVGLNWWTSKDKRTQCHQPQENKAFIIGDYERMMVVAVLPEQGRLFPQNGWGEGYPEPWTFKFLTSVVGKSINLRQPTTTR